MILRSRDLEQALATESAALSFWITRDDRSLELSAPGLARAEALDLADEIALAPDLETNRILITPGSAAEAAGLEDGDRILRVDGAPIATWDDITEHTRRAAERGASLALSIERGRPDGTSELLALSAEPEPWHPPYYGAFLRPALYEYRAASLGEAVRVGIQGSWKFLADAWNTVKRMLLGQVSAQNVGGIISIGVVSYSWASLGVAKLLFFLCMLSMNLAFLNVLPIPVLDGGHLLFLLIEKIKGRPVSERVLGYGQLVGIVLILSLMIFVTFNDLRRWTELFQP
jgi:regulator of sigma E protease